LEKNYSRRFSVFAFLHGLSHKRPNVVIDFESASPLIVLQKSKMRVRENFAIFPSQWIFGNTMPRNELTKEAGWKSGCLSDPLHGFRANAPAPLEKFAHIPEKSFATQSPRKRPNCRIMASDTSAKSCLY
jgi:hypothetical protein